MAYTFKEANVFDESLRRMNMIYDDCDDVIVMMSGGKDSTVLFHLAMQVARERGRLPLKVLWLDQEAEWQHTVDYMDKIMRLPDVEPYWFQIPFAFPNNLSTVHETLVVWDPEEKDKWIHPQSDIAITESPIDVSEISRDRAFYELMDNLPNFVADKNAKHTAVLSGMRAAESLHRRTAIMYGNAKFHGETWATFENKYGKRVFWPIYDYADDDVWTALAKNNWEYNGAYDLMYRWGTQKRKMRVSALVHETAWHSIEMLQEFEPKTYNRFVARINGTSTVGHAFDEGHFIPTELPFMFKDWKEYRDYLLVHLIDPKYWDHYKNEWKGQDTKEWYQTHVQEIVLNDTCGTVNSNMKSKTSVVSNQKTFMKKNLKEYMKWKGEQANGNS